jgi:hypothetical protein
LLIARQVGEVLVDVIAANADAAPKVELRTNRGRFGDRDLPMVYNRQGLGIRCQNQLSRVNRRKLEVRVCAGGKRRGLS